MSEAKAHATELLRRYDELRMELRKLEPALGKACSEYGRSIGVWGYHRDHLRQQLAREQGAAA